MNAALLLALAVLEPPLREESFRVTQPSEVVAVLTASCERCAWGRKGREAATLSLSVDGRYSQHLVLVQGAAPAEYRVGLGPLAPGTHRLSVALDRQASALGVRRAAVSKLAFLATPEGAGEHAALAFAPLLQAAPEFSGLPLLLWYETEPTPRGKRIRYSVILSGAALEAPDRLMAVWGRATDIRFVYAVELDAAGKLLAEEFAGAGGAEAPFAGPHEGRHALLSLVADGRLDSRDGLPARRYAPAPFAFGFMGAPREAVMDANPWIYRVMTQELARRGLLVADARQGSGRIPDPRRFAYVEACGELKDAVLALDVGVARGDKLRWREAAPAGPEFRIARSGCFRSAVALGSPAETAAIRALRFRAFAASGEGAAVGAGARLTRVNRLFVLGSDATPGPSLFDWQGDVALRAGDAPYTLRLPERR